jgi:ribosomal protein S18 acetylase RimI-like enzyme
MNKDDLLHLFDETTRRKTNSLPPGYSIEHDDGIWRLLGPSAASHDNCIVFSALNPEDADRAIARQIARFKSIGHDFEWKLYAHDRPADLAGRLVRHGFEPEESETVMIFDLGLHLLNVSKPHDITVRRVQSREALADVCRIREVVQNDDQTSFMDAIGDELEHCSEQICIYVAYDDAAPVAAAWLRTQVGEPFASLWGGSTLSNYRGRGIYRHLVGIRAAEAKRRGARWLTIDARPTSRPIVERLGFETLTETTPFIWRSHR